jgi:carboxyl-terminal processing protease
MRRNNSTLPIALTAALSAAVIFLCLGLWLGGHPNNLPQFARDAFGIDEDQAIRAEVKDSIQDNYYKKVSGQTLDEASLKGMVTALGDRFSHYFTPKEAKQFEQSVSGSFEGVGMTIDSNKRGLKVVSVFEGSPAKKAGINKGDEIVAVNGESIAGEPPDLATSKIKGPAGTPVRLTVDPAGKAKARTVTVKRARIKVPVVRGRTITSGGQKFGYVRLATFSSGAHGEVRRAIDRQLGRGARGIVLDLRGNGGGLLEEGVLVASIFVDKGVIVSTKGRTKPERKLDARGGAIDNKVPVVVLVDEGTASASEIVAGALRDHKRATLVGTKTFGKGVVQEVEPLSNGGLLDITVANYYLPGGDNLTKKGIVPPIKARDNPRTRRDEALPVALDALRKKLR